MVLLWIIGSLLAVSLLSLAGIFVLGVKKNVLDKVTHLLIAFSAGTLLGVTFFDLFPEAVELTGNMGFTYVFAGLVMFFVLESLLHWHHHEQHHHDQLPKSTSEKPVGYLIILGDAVHNFLDGIIVAAAFLVDIQLGLITTFSVMLHELPQEIGDYSVLVHAGFSKTKALKLNFLSALTSIVGGVLTFYYAQAVSGVTGPLLGVAAGGLLYIAATDLLPALHHNNSREKMAAQMVAFFIGALIMYVLSVSTAIP